MKTKKAYIYPVTARLDTGVVNPYIDDFVKSLKPYLSFLNMEAPSHTGFIDFLKYMFRVKYLFLNWIEDLPDKKYGKLQSFLLPWIVRFFQLTGGRVIWTLHNKGSHYGMPGAKQKLVDFLARNSNFVLTHAKAGELFAQELGAKAPIFYRFHPIKKYAITKHNKDYDLLIWGTITPYKALDKFFGLVSQSEYLSRLKILVTGKILDPDYETELMTLLPSNVELKNAFIGFDELGHYIACTRYVLFTYQSDSVLSSGALMDSLGFGAKVIGPHSGSFAELKELGIIETYDQLTDLERVLKKIEPYEESREERINSFVTENSWTEYGHQLFKWIQQHE